MEGLNEGYYRVLSPHHFHHTQFWQCNPIAVVMQNPQEHLVGPATLLRGWAEAAIPSPSDGVTSDISVKRRDQVEVTAKAGSDAAVPL